MSSVHRTRLVACLLLGGLAAVALLRGPGPSGASAATVQDPLYDQYRARATITLSGTARNFTPSNAPGGHADFLRLPTGGSGRYARIAADALDDDGKPAFGSTGFRVLRDWADAGSNAIISPKPYITGMPGDSAGSLAPAQGGAVSGPGTFAQWFRDAAGVNTSARREIALAINPGTGVYSFDGSLDGTFGSPDYSYTYELRTPFIFERSRGWYVSAATQADVWVYVDGKLVIDGGAGPGHLSAFAVDDSIQMSNTASITGVGGAPVVVSTNSTDAGDVRLTNSANINGDVMVGPGGNPAAVVQAGAGAITGSRGAMSAPLAMPVIPAPTGFGPSVGDRVYAGGTHTIAASFRCKTLTLQGNATVNISGEIRILADDTCDFGNNCTVNLLPGATLTIFSGGNFSLHNHCRVNTNTMDPDRVTLVNLGSTTMNFDNNGDFVGRIVSPAGPVSIGNSITITGSILARSAVMSNSGRFVGAGYATDALGMGVAPMTQRIDLDRLGWLDEKRTHTLGVYFANRLGRPSALRLETNIDLINVAALPRPPRERD